MSDFNWDDFNNTGEFMTFDNVGDQIAGEVLAVRLGQDFNGKPCPELVLRTAEGDRTLTAGQKVLQTRLAEERPAVGDRIAVVYSGVGDAKPGKAPAKLFDVAVQRAGQAPAPAAATVAAPVPTPAAPAAPAPAAPAPQAPPVSAPPAASALV
jgi:hypothetical protein